MLKTRGPIGVGEMARELGLTEMAVRRHLHTMERTGIVASSSSRQGVGRPMLQYSLVSETEELFPRNYRQLALDLLEELEAHAGGEAVAALFEGRKRKLFRTHAGELAGKPLAERVELLAGIQQANGYMAEWEEDGEDGYFFREHNCPIAQVASRYKAACRCEQQLFAELLEADVERTECLTEEGTRCVYRIRPLSALVPDAGREEAAGLSPEAE